MLTLWNFECQTAWSSRWHKEPSAAHDRRAGNNDDATRGKTQPGGRSQTAARSASASESFILLDLR